jgi:hypothetical protein
MTLIDIEVKMTKLKQKCIIIDLDWTVCYEPFIGDLPYGVEYGREAWDEYHAKREFYSTKIFKPIREISELIEGYYNSCYVKPMVIFLTSREDTANGLIRLNSYRFIRKNFKCFHDPRDYGRRYHLLMRKENDYRPSGIVKEEFLKNDILPYYNVTLAFDDDESNKNMFLKNGITVLQPYSIDVYNLINAE